MGNVYTGLAYETGGYEHPKEDQSGEGAREPHAEALYAGIKSSGYVLDPEGIHHEFDSGMHGQKLDFDKIPTGSTLMKQWVDAVAEKINELYLGRADYSRMALLSVANGTNRIVGPVARLLGDGVEPLLTQKDHEDNRKVILTPNARFSIENCRPELVVCLEDASTTGGTAAMAVTAARRAGAQRVEVINTWQRRPELERLVGIEAVYHSIIEEPVTTYTVEDCQRDGFCAQDWELIPR